ncbi:hypothetical protein COT98_02410 [Candidatus Falkowbacteria bacterium CG10_big_fil_rev_8_21_14_0_10_39_9]|uniref:Uncharacterized protein n=1 Tax=Candidatus Falkowbacteria bacterium CG10_big_fil_rev_8_21_14_0_10_39_9 TaxID=1974566 RepID=A0A2M6WPI5_9BACT|nr:MAG: hypothetical protein COT98_02410 [Candidatus Falkowbacteria bacterium CG10_big_fil_rev_8_21_14_0_10_39_9]
MFAIINDELYLASINSSLSHRDWLKSKKLLGADIDKDLNGITMVFVGRDGLYFCEGDFIITKRAEAEIFKYLSELMDKLETNNSLYLYGGFIKGKVGEKWLPEKDYGSLEALSR